MSVSRKRNQWTVRELPLETEPAAWLWDELPDGYWDSGDELRTSNEVWDLVFQQQAAWREEPGAESDAPLATEARQAIARK